MLLGSDFPGGPDGAHVHSVFSATLGKVALRAVESQRWKNRPSAK